MCSCGKSVCKFFGSDLTGGEERILNADLVNNAGVPESLEVVDGAFAVSGQVNGLNNQIEGVGIGYIAVGGFAAHLEDEALAVFIGHELYKLKRSFDLLGGLCSNAPTGLCRVVQEWAKADKQSQGWTHLPGFSAPNQAAHPSHRGPFHH